MTRFAKSIEQTAIDALIPYARNSRTHSEAQVAQIAASIREFGFTNPVLVDGDGGIIAGHGRVLAARKPPWKPPGRPSRNWKANVCRTAASNRSRA